ncbi:MAG: succinate--CoA ligase subunit alpha [Deltaproteobacteria bacterium]|nr:MAG: succinate--CoA ligase subunit alpha [Deltaproteobacteria bacterium]
MAILVDESTRVLVQGITGGEGRFHTKRMLEYGTKVVAGVTPGKGGQEVEGVPVFNTVEEAVRKTGANTSAVFVPAAFAAEAVMEAAEAGIGLIVCFTEGIPTFDMIRAKAFLEARSARLIGPNTPGVISPGKSKVGLMAGYIHREGEVGVISRSGTLTYEAVYQMSKLGIGQSTCVGIGGDQITGLDFAGVLELFREDEQTRAVLIIGEIGGTAEEDAASYIREVNYPKPVVAFIAGRTAPPGRRMGHAGAIISGGAGTAQSKIEALKEAGVEVVESPATIGEKISEVLSK